MTMTVHHYLPGRLASIESEVVPAGENSVSITSLQASIKEIKATLYSGVIEKIRRMPERNHEQVPPADRVPIPAGKSTVHSGRRSHPRPDCRTGISQTPCIKPPDLNEIIAFFSEPFNCHSPPAGHCFR